MARVPGSGKLGRNGMIQFDASNGLRQDERGCSIDQLVSYSSLTKR